MKKVIESVVVTSILTLFNYLLSLISHTIIGLTFHGGECVEKVGLGIHQLTIYPLSNGYAEVHTITSFNIISYVITLLIIYIGISIIKHHREL